jgi:peptidyl-tRNA hydrolase, PTH1 family
MILIVGLGNPEKKFKGSWHNLGQEALNFIYFKWQKDYCFSDWEKNKKLENEISSGNIKKELIILAKPLNFMNLSGKSVKKLVSYYKKSAEDLIIMHDDLDLPLGKIKIVKNRGAAGHKGVQSIINEFKSKNFIRFRIGIKPGNQKIKNPEKFVLQKFSKKDSEKVNEVIKKTVLASEMIIQQGLEKTMSQFNQ